MQLNTNHSQKLKLDLRQLQSCKRADYCRPEPENISPNPKTNLKPDSCLEKTQKLSKVWKISKCCQVILTISCAPKIKSTFQARIKPEILSTLDPNPTRKARPDLQVWAIILNANAAYRTALYPMALKEKKPNQANTFVLVFPQIPKGKSDVQLRSTFLYL